MNTTTRPATSGQYNKITELIIELTELNGDQGASWRSELELAWRRNQFATYEQVSKGITDLIAAKRALTPRTGGAGLPDVPEGCYALAKIEDPTDWVFYKITVNVRDGKTWVDGYLQISDELHKVDFKTLRGVLTRIVEATPLAASIAYGKEFKICGVCGKGLTNPLSRDRGIGPKCAKRIG